MPGWHKDVKDVVASGELVILGVTQEQHAERCQLFSQWQQFDWPILHDPINLLMSKAVPIVVAIDEHGVVRKRGPKADWVRGEFLSTAYPAPAAAELNQFEKAVRQDIKRLQEQANAAKSSAAYTALGDALTLWQREEVDGAVDAYNAALQQDESNAVTHFRLGVALRRRHDSAHRQQSDFARGVTHWTAALSMDPNQYIWRRRIQQYGPRLDKPYPFYDWVEQAITEVKQRGETPAELQVALSGAEIAMPAKTFSAVNKNSTTTSNPDPKNRIRRDRAQFVLMNVASVPAKIEPGENIRLHLEFRLTGKAVWNNESEPLRVWLDSTDGWQPERRLIACEQIPGAAESKEVRRIEVEFKSASNAKDESLRGYALYYICDKASGTCMLRRQDFAFQASIR